MTFVSQLTVLLPNLTRISFLGPALRRRHISRFHKEARGYISLPARPALQELDTPLVLQVGYRLL